MAHVWAGIVTYNPDIDRLEENIDAIKPQVEGVLIFDNGSNNVNEILYCCEKSPLICSTDNVGMAKALNRLAGVARSKGATDIVMLDQDSVVTPGFVVSEAAKRADGVGIVCPHISDRNVKVADVDRTLTIDVPRTITSGSMVNLEAWTKVGGYDERLFVDNVDNDFCDNLRAHGYRVVRTNAAKIIHEMGHQEHAWNAPGHSAAEGASHSYYRRNYPTWRWQDSGRSQAIIIRKYKGTGIGAEEKRRFWRLVARVILIEHGGLRNLRALMRGYREGTQVMRNSRPSDIQQEVGR